MSVLSYNALIKLVESGVIDAPIENVNGSSIDVRIDSEIMIEKVIPVTKRLTDKDSGNMVLYDISDGYVLRPGEFILASTMETFNLPDDISCEFKLKSSGARAGLDNALATWCDPGWHDSKLTLELVNIKKFLSLEIHPGDKIGQIIFHKVEPVPVHANYAKTGRYNSQTRVTAGKGEQK